MTAAAVIEAVREFFTDEVVTPQTLRVVYDNGPEPTDMAAVWCRFTVETDPPRQVTTAPAKFRMTGRATANLFQPIGKGDAGMLVVASAIEEAFTAATIATPDIHFVGRPGFVGVVAQSGAWFQRTMRIDFFADEIGTGD